MARKKITEADVKAAISVLEADYFNDVLGIAKEIAKELKKGEIDEDEVRDRIHEDVENDQRIIYTYQARIALLCSDNNDAYVDEVGEVPLQGRNIHWEALASAAMQQDVFDALDRHGVDVNDPNSWPDIDLSEFD